MIYGFYAFDLCSASGYSHCCNSQVHLFLQEEIGVNFIYDILDSKFSLDYEISFSFLLF